MTDEIAACPDCDSADIHYRTGKHNGRPGWKCENCKAMVEKPIYRTPHRVAGIDTSSLAYKLQQMSADEVP
jgi:ribosomal protein L37AE/L43A